MLSKYLHTLRASKRVTHTQALQSLGQGWDHNNNALVKNYNFDDFSQASNYLQRYTDYC